MKHNTTKKQGGIVTGKIQLTLSLEEAELLKKATNHLQWICAEDHNEEDKVLYELNSQLKELLGY